MIELNFYYREGCHLCDAMWHELGDYRSRSDLDFISTDITSNAALEQRYGIDIPVLTYADQVICRHFFDPALLDAFLKNNT